MNFFEHQAHARRRTTRLVILFALAVAMMVATVYAVTVVTRYFTTVGGYYAGVNWWQPRVLLAVAVGVVGMVGVASGFRLLTLRGGGAAVADAMGGRLVPPQTDHPGERRLHNVVEEMALASGVPVPPIYVLDEPGINAFAAGYGPDDAVIAVTRGTLENLRRDELQGVIAHEFSHILNRDIRLNLQLAGLVFGVLFLGLTGRLLVRTLGGSRPSRGGGAGVAVLAVVGLTLFVVGYVGVFFGRMIQRAISRQREFLADASAVQFTRNPMGLAGALKTIGGHPTRGELESPKAEEIRHFFFAEARPHGLASLWDTHPPLTERIRRLDPSFDGRLRSPSPRPFEMAGAHPAGFAEVAYVHLDPGQVVAGVAAPTAGHLRVEEAVRVAIPEVLREAAQTSLGAVAVVLALVLDPHDENIRARQSKQLREVVPPMLWREIKHVAAPIRVLDPRARLPLADLATPALRQLSPAQYRALDDQLHRLFRADERLALFEFALHQILHRRLDALFAPSKRGATIHRLHGVLPESLLVLGALAHAGHPHPTRARDAFQAGIYHLAPQGHHLPPAPPSPGPAELLRALDRLAHAAPPLKQQIVDACAHCALFDRDVTVAEAELLRVLVVALDCPLPPFLRFLD